MVILFECYGNFVSGNANYLALISKKSRGTIILTERLFSFKSLKDQILFQISVLDIENFIITKRFNLHTIELRTDKVNAYSFYPHKSGKSSLGSSRSLTEDLFRELTRAIFKKGYPVLYETKAGFWEGIPSEENWKATLEEGFLILTENGLSFKPFETNFAHNEKITRISEVHRELVNSVPYILINNTVNKTTSYLALKNNSRHIKEDELKTDKLFELIIQAKDYKETEQIQIIESKKQLIQKIKSILEVSNKLKLDIMRTALDMDQKEFYEKVFIWAKKFNFLIEGDEIVVDHDSIPRFMDSLDKGFRVPNIALVKVKCVNCGKNIEYLAKICPYCGREN
ncbi:MAG: zinc ribbon domain-containing protein [Promethearchaeota archaeon]|nr:MAG: zinc ribbon domain-containing protein [Candidatus Lokiarchaeota archaeon]